MKMQAAASVRELSYQTCYLFPACCTFMMVYDCETSEILDKMLHVEADWCCCSCAGVGWDFERHPKPGQEGEWLPPPPVLMCHCSKVSRHLGSLPAC